MVDKRRTEVGVVDSRDGTKQTDLDIGYKEVAEMAAKDTKVESMEYVEMVDIKLRKDVYIKIVEIETGEEDISNAIENIVNRMESLEQDLDATVDEMNGVKDDMNGVKDDMRSILEIAEGYNE